MSIIPPQLNNIDPINSKDIIGGVNGAFLSDKQKDQIIDAEGAMHEANDSIDDTRYEIKGTLDLADEAEAQGKDGESKKAEAQNQASDTNAMQAQTADAQANAANSSQKAGAANEVFASASEEFNGLIEDGNAVVDEQTQEVEDIDAEIEELTASMDADMETIEKAAEKGEEIEDGEVPGSEGMPSGAELEYDPNLANGPVGAGNASADQSINTLKTQTEKDEENGTLLGTPEPGTPGAKGTAPMPKPAPAPVAPKAPADPVQSEVVTDTPAASSSSTPDFDPEEVKAATERVTENQSAIETYTTRSSVTLERINENTENTQALMQEQQDAVQASIDEGNAENEGLANAAKAVGVISQVGSYTEKTGQVTEAVGFGLQSAGVATATAGAATTGTGTFLSGLGGALTSLGAPLCSLFGIGSPIVAGGGVTIASGSATTSTGVTVSQTGASLITSGNTTQNVGQTTKRVGQGLSLGANTANVAITAASGDWRGAITSGLNVAASAASFAGDFIKSGAEAAGKAADCIDKISDVTGRIASGASMVDNAAKTVEAFQNGDLEGGIKSGLNMTLSGMAMGAKGDFARGISNTQAGIRVADSGMNLARTIQNGGNAKDIAKASWNLTETTFGAMGTVADNKQKKIDDANKKAGIEKKDTYMEVYVQKKDKDGNITTEAVKYNSGKKKGQDLKYKVNNSSNKFKDLSTSMQTVSSIEGKIESGKNKKNDKNNKTTSQNQSNLVASVKEEDPKKNISLKHKSTTKRT